MSAEMTLPTIEYLVAKYPSASDISHNGSFIIVENTKPLNVKSLVLRLKLLLTRKHITDLRVKRDILYAYNIKENRELTALEIEEQFN